MENKRGKAGGDQNAAGALQDRCFQRPTERPVSSVRKQMGENGESCCGKMKKKSKTNRKIKKTGRKICPESSKVNERKSGISATFGLISRFSFFYNNLDVQEENERARYFVHSSPGDSRGALGQ